MPGCPDPAAAVYWMPGGCVCLPGVKLQALCAHHEHRAGALGGMELVRDLRAADVFGYAAVHRIPLHPTYGMTGGGRWPREHLRVAFLTLRHGDQFGRREWEREYYGDVLARLAAGRTSTSSVES